MADSSDLDPQAAGGPATPRRRTVMAAALGCGLLSACAADPIPIDAAPGDATSADPTSAGPTSSDPTSSDLTAAGTSTSPTPSATPTSKPSAKAATSSTTKAGTTKVPAKTSSSTTSTTGSTASKTSSTTKTSTTKTSTTKTTTKAPEPVDATLAEIPVGGTVVKTINGRAVALTRPSSGTVRAFDARCTHAGCPVQAAGSQFQCPCHGSAFSTSGAVLNGPATQPLAGLAARVHDGGVSIG